MQHTRGVKNIGKRVIAGPTAAWVGEDKRGRGICQGDKIRVVEQEAAGGLRSQHRGRDFLGGYRWRSQGSLATDLNSGCCGPSQKMEHPEWPKGGG